MARASSPRAVQRTHALSLRFTCDEFDIAKSLIMVNDCTVDNDDYWKSDNKFKEK